MMQSSSEVSGAREGRGLGEPHAHYHLRNNLGIGVLEEGCRGRSADPGRNTALNHGGLSGDYFWL